MKAKYVWVIGLLSLAMSCSDAAYDGKSSPARNDEGAPATPAKVTQVINACGSQFEVLAETTYKHFINPSSLCALFDGNLLWLELNGAENFWTETTFATDTNWQFSINLPQIKEPGTYAIQERLFENSSTTWGGVGGAGFYVYKIDFGTPTKRKTPQHARIENGSLEIESLQLPQGSQKPGQIKGHLKLEFGDKTLFSLKFEAKVSSCCYL